MITLDSVWFGYRRDEPIISDLTWRFTPGAMTAVTGPSGRGKSTLLYLIGLLLTPWSGAVRAGDVDLGGLSDGRKSRFRATRVGFVFQDAALDPTRTVLDNIVESHLYNDIPRGEAVRRARELMERFEVALRADHKPGEVSGGQAQRIALCRALLARPDLILADEPTGNLDVRTSQLVVDTLAELAGEQRTVIIATHDPDIVGVCDEVLEL
ncbi:MAG: lipoprotein-releasing system ATP-binding protein LolD 1 [Acidimicrobiia bacterium]|nr:MAG: lipoprotein-releasing system ATP-binding protein LolD 1 [Acidimicrobiia bacterium]